MSQWIRVYASQDSGGLWDVERRRPIDTTDLSITAELRERLAKWTEWFWHDNPVADPDRPAAFAAEGLTIARLLKAELPSRIVNYYDQAAAGRNIENDIPHEDHPDPWDYEITL